MSELQQFSWKTLFGQGRDNWIMGPKSKNNYSDLYKQMIDQQNAAVFPAYSGNTNFTPYWDDPVKDTSDFVSVVDKAVRDSRNLVVRHLIGLVQLEKKLGNDEFAAYLEAAYGHILKEIERLNLGEGGGAREVVGKTAGV